MGESTTTVEQMMRYYESTGNQYPAEALGKGGAPTLRDFCQIYYDEATAEGVKAEVAFGAGHERKCMVEIWWYSKD